MQSRRAFLLAGLALPSAVAAQPRARLDDPLRVGVDQALADSGLARALHQAFGRDTGIAVKLQAGPASAVLDALERGELDATISNAPDAEGRLVQLGLAHDRQLLATSAFAIVGPAARRKQRDPADIGGERDVLAAFTRLRDAGAAGQASFLSAGDGSGTHLLEQALWRAAGIAPATPWYGPADAGGAGLAAQARARGAYALVDRAAWAVQGGAPLAVLVEGDARLALPVHTMRAFRSRHAAARLFVGWIAGPRGRRVAAGFRGVR